MKFSLKTLTYLSIAALSLISASAMPVNTAVTNNSHQINTNKQVINKKTHENVKFSQQLAKEGYTFRLTPGNSDQGLQKKVAGLNNPHMKRSTLKKLIRNKTNFKVYRVWEYKNGLMYKAVSKSGKYRGWVDDTTLYNKHYTDKSLQPVIKMEKKAINVLGSKPPTTKVNRERSRRYLNKALMDAQQLHGKERKIAINSVKQTKSYVKTLNVARTPTLLWQKI